MTWPKYRRKLNAAGYRADVTSSWVHKTTCRRIYPFGFGMQVDGKSWINWQFWAAQDPPFVPPPF